MLFVAKENATKNNEHKQNTLGKHIMRKQSEQNKPSGMSDANSLFPGSSNLCPGRRSTRVV